MSNSCTACPSSNAMETPERILAALAGIFLLGIGGQWLAWRIRMPSILLLLGLGIVVGPVLEWLVPDKLFGQLLLPTVSLAVGVILFEGGLSLRMSDLREIGRPLLGLLTIGVVVTWVTCSLAARFMLGMSWDAAILLGAILVVTGPTVIGPLLQHIRPLGNVGPIALWEGIVIDPIGAVLAVLAYEVLEAMRHGSAWEATISAGSALLLTVTIGLGLGLGLAATLSWFLRRHWIPDHLQSPVTLTAVVVAVAASHLLQHESGLVTATVMGIYLANQQATTIKHIVDFKENLTVLLISSLFIILSARLKLEDFTALGTGGLLFVAIVIVVARPLSVWLSTANSELNWRERAFLSWLAPRGIVAAAVASVFALELGTDGDQFVAATFLVIVSTVAVYALTSGWVARILGLSVQDAQGVLIAGANATARSLATALDRAGIEVQLVDTNRGNVQAARMQKLQATNANVLSETATEHLNLAGIGYFVALTPNDEVNVLACQHFSELFGRSRVFRVAADKRAVRGGQPSIQLQAGRVMSGQAVTYRELLSKIEAGWTVKSTKLSEKFDHAEFRRTYGDEAIHLMSVHKPRRLVIHAQDAESPLNSAVALIALVPPSAA